MYHISREMEKRFENKKNRSFFVRILILIFYSCGSKKQEKHEENV